MIGQRVEIWREDEYAYPAAWGFIPVMVTYLHEDTDVHPAMLVVPGGAYRYVSPSEGDVVARRFYEKNYNVFVLAYTVNYFDEPLRMQPLNDISRAVRIIRTHAEKLHIDPKKLAVCGFSAGGHLCASLCVHYKDISDPRPEFAGVSNRPDAAVLSYPVITSGEYANRESFLALLGKDASEEDLEYMSLEKQVTEDTPPCFLWQTATDRSVPVENSCLFAEALRKCGVPYAHHIFSDGVHGMSVASEEWLEGKYRDTYTLEQIKKLAAAVREGKTDYPPEKADEILREFGLDGNRPDKWTPEEKERLRGILPEVGVWPELAEKWLEREWAGQ
ncbi:MAG TPA: alpha/beta hydrolase [Candidatus Mediterraneibacter caccogallinarum]|nr:alpha/beta hydrolase [Candidatus Mediterraneibacter caccogallinarum]